MEIPSREQDDQVVERVIRAFLTYEWLGTASSDVNPIRVFHHIPYVRWRRWWDGVGENERENYRRIVDSIRTAFLPEDDHK